MFAGNLTFFYFREASYAGMSSFVSNSAIFTKVNIPKYLFVLSMNITGDSMFPLWRHRRDTAVLTKYDKTALRKGDIPLYRRRTGQYVMHRIIKVNRDGYNLCGDAQTQIEYNFSKENIIAIVKAFTRKGKKYCCSDLWYRVYTVFWIGPLPFRRIMLLFFTVKYEIMAVQNGTQFPYPVTVSYITLNFLIQGKRMNK